MKHSHLEQNLTSLCGSMSVRLTYRASIHFAVFFDASKCHFHIVQQIRRAAFTAFATEQSGTGFLLT